MEEWRKIVDYPNYSVSNLGNVRNDKTGLLLKASVKRGGYYGIRLSKNSIKEDFLIHHLVANHFLENPENKPIIDHIDRNRTNNCLDNLRWITRSGNGRNRTKQQGIYSSKYSGVYFHQPTNKYLAQIRVNGKRIHLGYFETEEDAGNAYNDFNTKI